MSTIAATRQQQILDAAARCFARRGFHRSTMQDICSEAKMSPGSLYRYYTSKEEIITAMVERDRVEVLEVLERIGQYPNLIDALEAETDHLFADVQQPELQTLHIEVAAEALRNPTASAILQQSNDQYINSLAAIVAEHQRQGAIDTTLNSTAVAQMLFAINDGIAFQRALSPDQDYEPLRQTILILLNRLLRP